MLIEPIDIVIPTLMTEDEIAPRVEMISNITRTPHRVITTCQKVSASANRNIGLDQAKSPIIIMIDDDIIGFFDGWEQKIIEPIIKDHRVCMVSARLMNKNGTTGPNCADNHDLSIPWIYLPKRNHCVMPSAAIAFVDKGLRFDENFIGSGWEDNDFCFQYLQLNPEYKFVLNNECPLIHLNEMKNQQLHFQHNQRYFYEKWKIGQ